MFLCDKEGYLCPEFTEVPYALLEYLEFNPKVRGSKSAMIKKKPDVAGDTSKTKKGKSLAVETKKGKSQFVYMEFLYNSKTSFLV